MKIRIFLLSFIFSLPFWWGVNIFQENLENYFYAQISQPFEEIVFVKIPPPKPKLELQAKAAISVKLNENGAEKILFNKNINQPLPIASLTKLMTAVIVLEDQNYDLDNNWITISEKAAHQENVPNYGNLDKYIGKKFTLKQLLDLMLIYSSNDAAYALAEQIGVENFVEKMNQKAKELGLENTHFVNPTGLDPENLYYHPPNQSYFNYSTAQDLLKLAQYILKNHPLIFEITLKKGPYPVENGMGDLILPENQRAIGWKTGYTKEAGGCALLVLGEENGILLFNIILGTESQEARIREMQKLINHVRNF
jgi:D-alanyl-D-alanine carboxypeptidase (penicillin-binding protein 5/6)